MVRTTSASLAGLTVPIPEMRISDSGMSMTSISISSRSSSRCAKFADRIEGAKRGFMMKSNGQPPVVHIRFSEAPSESRFVCLSLVL